ncbi:MAG: hypothetical protein HOC63_11750 [Rhodospirillales bacterium]|jgi:hypothetical protein|nr:hypothetical protein [Rhodospirillales bacterium]MBT7778416.1 hypothetical protein [Rhodospirillales bacterium]
MASKNTTAELGDRYIKVDAPGIVWVVSELLNVSDPVPHVRLVQEGSANRKITLSASALQDTNMHRKV